MDLHFDTTLAQAYSSSSQQIRVMSERWAQRHLYCPNCGQQPIVQYENNRPVADFRCAACGEDYELKSKKGASGPKVPDGAFGAMMERLRSSAVPSLFVLNYDFRQLAVTNLIVVPRQFFVPEIIERRKPLGPKAKRAGWVGCNILLRNVPATGRVSLVTNGAAEPKTGVLANWRRMAFLREQTSVQARGWLLSVMRCVEALDRPSFTLDEVYGFEPELRMLYPGNRHIREKVRQQLQVLRDKGYLEFMGRGAYRLTAA